MDPGVILADDDESEEEEEEDPEELIMIDESDNKGSNISGWILSLKFEVIEERSRVV